VLKTLGFSSWNCDVKYASCSAQLGAKVKSDRGLTGSSAAGKCKLVILLLLLLLLTAIGVSLGGSSPYTSTDKTRIYINDTIKNTVQTVQNTINTTHI
jgi:hypothetical protein